jgi:proton-dependent oligopeptide transporter, POT family
LIVIVELCERFSFYGCKGVWTNYIKNRYDDPLTPGMLGLGPMGALGLQKFFTFWAYSTPIGGAIIADQRLGRYKTIILGCIFYIIGGLILTLTSIPLPSLTQTTHVAGFISAIIFMGLGTGGIKSNVSALVAEQCTGTTRKLKQLQNEWVIVDPAVTAHRIYMYFYFAINVGSLGSALTAVMEHKIGFWSAYVLPLISFVGAMVIVIAGRRTYILRKPQGSVTLDAFKALNIARKKGWKLDAAKPANTPGVPWDDQFVNELKRALVACKVRLPLSMLTRSSFSTPYTG